jgi:DHA1 family multidrug resistance protein-like MFS transporter
MTVELEEYRRNFLVICAAEFCFALSMSVIDPFLPGYVASFDVSYALIGLVMSAFGVTRVFVEIPGGVLADRLGQRSLLFIGFALAFGSHLLGGVAHSYVELIVSRMIVGVGSAFSMTAGLMYIGELAPPAQRQRNIARYQSTFSMGGILGPTLGGVLSDLLGIRMLFFIAAGLTSLGMALIFTLRITGSPSPTGSGVPISKLGELVKDPLTLVFCAATFLTFFLFSSIRGTMIPLYGTSVLALTSTQIGVVFSVTSAIIVLVLVGVVPRLESRIRGSRMLVISLALSAVAVAALSVAPDFLTLALLALPLGVGFGLLQPTPFAMVLDRASVENRGLVVGLLRTTGDVGIIVGPLLVGGLLDLGHPALVFYVVAAIIALFALLSWRILQTQAGDDRPR